MIAAACGDRDVLGVLEVVNKDGGSAFTIDDIEIVTMLAEIAGAAMGEHAMVETRTEPRDLVRLLEPVAAADPIRYALVARVVHALLAPGA